MSEAWIGVVGVALGTLLGGWLAFRSAERQIEAQDRRERKRLVLNRLEQLHETLTEWSIAYDSSFGERVKNLPAGLPVEGSSGPRVPVERLQMLVGIYAPALQENAAHLMAVRESYGEALVETMTGQDLPPEERKRLLGGLGVSYRRMGGILDEFQEAVAREAQKQL